jgi:adenylate cyclase class IV
MENEFKELEFKYYADNVDLVDFNSLMSILRPKIKKDVSSWDVYYTLDGNKEEFQRFRDSQTPELTKKRKVNNSNNWERIESDLPLDPARVNEAKVEFHLGMDGYKKNFKIYKSCFIYWFDNVNAVYYIVYDENLHEKGRFIEIEVNKDKAAELGVEKAFKELKIYEQNLSKLGIGPQNRLKKSLFEMFVK